MSLFLGNHEEILFYWTNLYVLNWNLMLNKLLCSSSFYLISHYTRVKSKQSIQRHLQEKAVIALAAECLLNVVTFKAVK